PTNYTVQLTLNGEGQITIFQAVESNGGTNYLFDETTASNQVVGSTSLYVGHLAEGFPIILGQEDEHLIFCGARAGDAQIHLQVLDADQNIIGDSSLFLRIKDVKQMYERWTLGDNPYNGPTSAADLASEDVSIP